MSSVCEYPRTRKRYPTPIEWLWISLSVLVLILALHGALSLASKVITGQWDDCRRSHQKAEK